MRRAWLAALPLIFGLTAAAKPIAEVHPPMKGYAYLPAAQPERGELRVRFMGVSTLLFTDGDTSILIDGFFSRPKLWRVAGKRLRPNDENIDHALQNASISSLDMVVAVHAHFDHAMDSAVVADRTGALLVGNASAAQIGIGAGLPERRILEVEGGDRFEVGDFRVKVIATRHGFPNLAPGDIEQPLCPPAHALAYKEGGSLSFLIEHRGLKMLVHSTAGFEDDDADGIKADVVFLGIGGIARHIAGFEPYWDELVRQTDASLIVPIHWDVFGRSLRKPLKPMPGFSRSMRILDRLARPEARTIALMPTFQPVDIGEAKRRARQRRAGPD